MTRQGTCYVPPERHHRSKVLAGCHWSAKVDARRSRSVIRALKRKRGTLNALLECPTVKVKLVGSHWTAKMDAKRSQGTARAPAWR